ncbi:rho GTPase-activating protein 12-like isoform X4 [Bacillus rossius redtenbacheri]|uniref:rho GTPase-activating protein 12-like isoform X4 n=1 Tax=Bacillus rossius redtenbacheri TaxID=93214 RepID=UPI002FDDE862
MSDTEIPDVLLRVLYDFEYVNKDKKVSIKRGEKLFLIKKTNPDWWQVIRNSSQGPFYVPAQYVQEFKKQEKKPLVYKKSSSNMDIGCRQDVKVQHAGSHVYEYGDYRKTEQLAASNLFQQSLPNFGSDEKIVKQVHFVSKHDSSSHTNVEGADKSEQTDAILLDERERWVVEDLVLKLSELHNINKENVKGKLRQAVAVPKSEELYSIDTESANLDLNAVRKKVESTFKVPMQDPQHYLEGEGSGICESKHSLSKSDKTDAPLCYIPTQTDNVETSQDNRNSDSWSSCIELSSSAHLPTCPEEKQAHIGLPLAAETLEHGNASSQQTVEDFKATEPSPLLCSLEEDKKTEDRKKLMPITDKMLGKVKSKLSYSRSFKAKKDSHSGNHRCAGNSVLSSSWETKLDSAGEGSGAESSVSNLTGSSSEVRANDVCSTSSNTSRKPSKTDSTGCNQVVKSNVDDANSMPGKLGSCKDGKSNVVTFNSLTDICRSHFDTLRGGEVKAKLSKSALAVDNIFSSYSDSEDVNVPGNSLLETKDISADSMSVRSEQGLCLYPSEKSLKFKNNREMGLMDSVLYVKSDEDVLNFAGCRVDLEDSCNDDIDSGKGTGRGSSVSRSRVRLQQECKHALSPPSPDTRRKPNKILGRGWLEYSTADGRPYFWNLFSRAKSWKPPRGLHRQPDYSPGSSIENLRSQSTSPVAESAGVSSYIPLPEGWNIGYDEDGQPYYTNETSNVKWFSSLDSEGRVYYFEENSNESSWALPSTDTVSFSKTQEALQMSVIPKNENVKKKREQVLKSLENDEDLPLRHKQVFTEDIVEEMRSHGRVSKSRSMVLFDPKHKSGFLKSSTTSEWPQLWKGDMGVLKEGPLNRTKITENGKRLRKNWSPAYVVLTELFLLIFKDNKAFAAMKNITNSSGSSPAHPELCVDLNGALIDHANKESSRKNVFIISTVLGLQVLLQSDNAQLAEKWYQEIDRAIKHLPSGYDSCTRPKLLKDRTEYFRPYSPDDGKKSSHMIERSRSVKVRNKDGSSEDLSTSADERQTKIRDRLKKFFHRRPTKELLMKKGIYKDEPVFGRHLADVCSSENPPVPRFVRLCIEAIESKEENMKADGLYRASGNLSQVQKIRLQVDQNNLTVLEQEEDVHVLTGALKLFFRELKSPVIPFEFFNTALQASTNSNKKEKIHQFQVIVKKLPTENRCTLEFLLQHLLKVTKFHKSNRMHISNLAIVFGPTLMWPEEESLNMAFDLMQQNLVIECFLQEFDNIFR